MKTTVTMADVSLFGEFLRLQEKSEYTVRKYTRDAERFVEHLDGRELTKGEVVRFKNAMMDSGLYLDTSINSVITSIRCFLGFLERRDCAVSNLKVQDLPFSPEERCLTVDEYRRLLNAAEKSPRMNLMLRVMFSTGIRVSELRFFTVEAIKGLPENASVRVKCKKKNRGVFVVEGLRQELMWYIDSMGLRSGPIFCTRSGRPLDRSNIWKSMKSLCRRAGVPETKVFPHSLRKLFARTYYGQTHDIVQLACLLGHNSINTTKIYVKTTEEEVKDRVERMVLSTLFPNEADMYLRLPVEMPELPDSAGIIVRVPEI